MTGSRAPGERDEGGRCEVSREEWLARLAKECRCCFECERSRPCDGLMAGGFCDRMCVCPDESGDDAEEWDDPFDDNDR